MLRPIFMAQLLCLPPEWSRSAVGDTELPLTWINAFQPSLCPSWTDNGDC
jgi:hypothetical protein